MKPFESFLAPQLEEYLSYRESLGYLIMPARNYLRAFDRYLKKTRADWDTFQPAFFLEMRVKLRVESRSINAIISAVRGFSQFLVRRGYLTHNPLNDIPPLKENTIVPFVFSPEQVDELLKTLCSTIRNTRKCFLTDLAIYLAVLLMARCGMRISETIKLLRIHYRRDDVTIYIERTKFGKDRLIPVQRDVAIQIENYLSVRKTLRPHDDNPYLLAGRKNHHLCDSTLRYVFHNAVKKIGLHQPRRIVGDVNLNPPTPHSLRHSFAVNTLNSVRDRELSSQNALPILAAYLGHRDYKCTSVYLRVSDAIGRKDLVDFSLWQKRKE